MDSFHKFCSFQFKMKISTTPLCTFCGLKVKPFWKPFWDAFNARVNSLDTALQVNVKSAYGPSGSSSRSSSRPCDMKRLLVYLRYPKWVAIQQPASIKFAGTPLYMRLERGTVRVKCLAQEHNTMSPARLKHGLLDPLLSALTTRPPHLPPCPLGQHSSRFL